jgi:type VII secretion-associated protein (TIGR03931 family)
VDAGALATHRAVIEAGPAGVRRLCCTIAAAEAETTRTALDGLDDPVVLVDDNPLSTESLWRSLLQSVLDGAHTSLAIVHPSWWSASRVDVMRCAASGLMGDVVMRRRSELLAGGATVVVEIADRFVVITGAEVVVEQRDGEACLVAENVTRVVASEPARAVSIDAPTAISGAPQLAELIADRVREVDADLAVTVVDDAALSGMAVRALSADDRVVQAGRPDAVIDGRKTSLLLIPVLVVVLAAALLSFGVVGRRSAPPADAMPTTFLVEGRVALTVPAHWTTRRVVAGPGSARVQITSPIDSETALHVTQSPVVDATLSDTAETLRRAIDEAPAGVFIDFNPNERRSGRNAVTYREIRAGHDVRWVVLLDGAVRISIGCQSRSGDDAAVRDACELAVRSAHALR